MTKPPVSLRLFAASVTNLLRKLHLNVLFRTEFIVITAIFILCFANVALVAISLQQLHIATAQTVVGTVSQSINDLQNGGLDVTALSSQMMQEITALRDANLIIVFSISMVMTLLFGYVVVRAALMPTKAALETQRHFIGNITHELRTPLSILKANSELLLMQEKDPENQATLRSNIEEIDRVAEIINNLLTLTSFRRGNRDDFAEVDVSTVVRMSVEKLAGTAAGKQLVLDADISSGLTAWGSQSGIAQIVNNLIKNAITYTAPGGSVQVECHRASHHHIALTIIDTGIGIESKKLKHIFEPFYQVEPSRTKQRGTSGLGLSIVSDIVKLHRGKITITSTVGVGTTVHVELPTYIPKHRRKIAATQPTSGAGEFKMDYTKRT